MMSENLNDIFALEDNEKMDGCDGIKVTIINRENSFSHEFVAYPENTLGEIVGIAQESLALGNDLRELVAECNGVSTSDMNITMEKLGVRAGSKLVLNPHGKVA